jgi:intergrase/recombinase
MLEGFDVYLKGVLTSDKDIVHTNRVANKYREILITGNASEFHSLTKDVRRNAMRALAHLAKYNGRYEQWQKIVKQNGLRWKQADDNFNFFEKEDIGEMLEYVKRIVRTYSRECGNAFIFATLTGLRASEACQAIKLIKQAAKGYYSTDFGGMLEHFRFKDIFIRRSKKAFVSLVDDGILDLARQSCDNWNAIRSRLKREDTEMHMAYCRKIFCTWLRQSGVETEFIDLLQGRVPATVFAKNYYRPSFERKANASGRS